MQVAHKLFIPGMYVRIPLDTDRQDHDFREFRIGQVHSIDVIAQQARVLFEHPRSDDESPQEVECPLAYIERCHILPHSYFTTKDGIRSGKVLFYCDEHWTEGQFCEYFVLFDGKTQVERLNESLIRVSSVRQDPDPLQQLCHYEFQHPRWRGLRDQVIKSYNTLHNATFGIEDLVGSRIRLLAHQAEVIAKVLSDPECRYILADEVGLGKTIEACVILRGLLRQNKHLQVLIIVPSSLTQQWHNELNSKFWLEFPVLRPGVQAVSSAGYIISHEDLAQDITLWQYVKNIPWGLLIVDEAHHLRKHQTMYDRVHTLSALSRRALILSATPIQRYAKEYLKLLALMHPQKYRFDDEETFAEMLKLQSRLLKRIALITQTLQSDEFDPEEFEEEIDTILRILKHDSTLQTFMKQFLDRSFPGHRSLEQAREIMSYLSENYRLEKRVLRNRRVHLTISLPVRQLNTAYSYTPLEEEAAALASLFNYIQDYIGNHERTPLSTEYCRLLAHAAASSPHALLSLLAWRAQHVKSGRVYNQSREAISSQYIYSSSPREEPERIKYVLALAPTSNEELSILEELIWRTENWRDQTNQFLYSLSTRREIMREAPANRLAQVLFALDQILQSKNKVVVFSSWLPTLEALLPHLQHRFGSKVFARFDSRLDMDQLQDEADKFQNEELCRVLLCDELGGEGRNFQIASHIIHIDLPWTPAQIEQRIGRVDRLGRSGVVISVVPFALGWPEHDLFRIWHEAFHIFTHSISGLEIALENVQKALLDALVDDPFQGLAGLLEDMVERADGIRQKIEEERYFEEVTINRRQRDEFDRISEEYSSGKKLLFPLLQWADFIGVKSDYDTVSEILTFSPRRFDKTRLRNAKFFHPPNMEEALRRSGRQREFVIRGTFNRDIAVRRENLVFFAPSSDPWTDTLIANAVEADRGRCCAIQRKLSAFTSTWEGFEFFFSISVDPRPLYAVGLDPSQLYRALGFLRISTDRVVVSLEGEIMPRGSAIWHATGKAEFSEASDIHLGRREEHWSGEAAQLPLFKQQYPEDEWQTSVISAFAIAERHLKKELEFMEQEAEDAKMEFARYESGMRASSLWMRRISNNALSWDTSAVDTYKKSSTALVEGLKHPLVRLESVCFWKLVGA